MLQNGSQYYDVEQYNVTNCRMIWNLKTWEDIYNYEYEYLWGMYKSPVKLGA